MVVLMWHYGGPISAGQFAHTQGFVKNTFLARQNILSIRLFFIVFLFRTRKLTLQAY